MWNHGRISSLPDPRAGPRVGNGCGRKKASPLMGRPIEASFFMFIVGCS